MVRIKVETWRFKGSVRGRRIFVARDNKGRLIETRPYAGSGLTKREASGLFKRNRTFFENVEKRRLENVTEVVSLFDSSLSARAREGVISRPPRRNAQYVIVGYYGSKRVYARSLKLGTPLCETPSQCKSYAWRKFLYNLGNTVSGNYDSNEGLRLLDRVRSVQEGWVYYS